MKPRSLTVFVQRRGGVFEANTRRAEAISIDSATCAARRAAALEFEVPECDVEVMPNGEHLMIATLREPGKPIATVFLTWAAIFLAMAGAVFVVLLKGRS
jgi:hypothetical protein